MLVNGVVGASLGNLSGGTSTGGSVQSAHGYNQSQNQSYSNTAGEAATAQNMASAQRANQQQMEMTREAMEFNAREAQKQREWQEKMANTIYTRSVKNMKEAGINPILAASMGLSGASVGSGATANISSPSAHMGTAIAEQNSASTGSAYGENWSSGSSWSESSSGLAEGLKQMGELIGGAIQSLNSSKALNDTVEKLSNFFHFDGTGEKRSVKEAFDEMAQDTGKATLNILDKLTKKEVESKNQRTNAKNAFSHFYQKVMKGNQYNY